ncbi:hypothetical protein GQ53DRAFT_849853 [Thozetella sp. PMI_491]|nr:hypothetical protein GQ53DRAFT_849853 [Thozetella sp. PMI_491]
MKANALFIVVLSCAHIAATWSTTNHWQTTLTTWNKQATASSISVYPIGSVSATSANISTSLFTSMSYTLVLTVHDLFYASDASVCTRNGLKSCGPTPALSSKTSGAITTTYWTPVPISNPASCTKTSFDYTTASTILLPSPWITDVAEQATQSVHAVLVTTYVSTLGTNLGNQAVTTTVCDVYLRSEAASGDNYVAEASIASQCMDPRDYYCQALSSGSPYAWDFGTIGKTCQRTGQIEFEKLQLPMASEANEFAFKVCEDELEQLLSPSSWNHWDYSSHERSLIIVNQDGEIEERKPDHFPAGTGQWSESPTYSQNDEPTPRHPVTQAELDQDDPDFDAGELLAYAFYLGTASRIVENREDCWLCDWIRPSINKRT